VFKERIEREYNIDLVITAPSVVYEVVMKRNKEVVLIDNPSKVPDTSIRSEVRVL
jgi:GTP-binding protein LepA